MTSRITAAVVAFVAAVVLSACGGSIPQSRVDQNPTGGPAIAGQPAGHNADDVAFAINMIPHHRQAVEMSMLARQRSTDPEVVALAEQIAAAQHPEIKVLQVFLVQWQENPQDSVSDHGGHGATMPGMVDDATMARLQTLSGSEFDTLWLQSMISHHRGAIEMARAEIAHGVNVDAQRLAQTIIDTQQAEIGQMNRIVEERQ